MPTHPSNSRPVHVGPLLRPGALLLRRDARTLLIGTSPGIPVRDRPGLVRVLRLLDGSLDEARLAAVVARDIPEFTADLSPTIDHLVGLGVVLRASPDPHPWRVAVRPDRSTSTLAGLLTDALGPSTLDPDLEIVLSAGEPPRSSIETLWSAGVAHLPVVVDEDGIRVGPFVRPGLTPCLGCLDIQRIEGDPAWSALVPQFERPRLLPAAASPRLVVRAAAEVIAHVEAIFAGDRPPSWAATVRLTDRHVHAARRPLPFATSCSCMLLVA